MPRIPTLEANLFGLRSDHLSPSAHPEEDRAGRGPSRRAVVTLYELAAALGVSHVELVRED